MTPPPWPFAEWGRITRFLESGRLAFARERELWSSLELDQRDDLTITTATGPKNNYRVKLRQHLDALADEETFHAAVLLQSYALTTAAVSDHLAIDTRGGGIEQWGTSLLNQAGTDWNSVRDGLAGAVEVAVTRNAYAHGTRQLDPKAAARLERAGITNRPAGTAVTLTYPQLQTYRARLLSLMNAGQLGSATA